MTKSTITLFLLLIISSCKTEVKVDDNLIGSVISMEDKVQHANILQTDFGNSYYYDVQSEYLGTRGDQEMKMKSAKLKYYLDKMEEIDAETSTILALIDGYKMDLLKNAGENISLDRDEAPTSIFWSKSNSNSKQMLNRLNLRAVKDKSNSEIATTYFTSSVEKPSTKGIELWKAFNSYRHQLVSIVGTSIVRDRNFTINPSEINEFKNVDDLVEKVTEMLKASNANLMEDESILLQIYLSLTKQEFKNREGKKVHFIDATFNDMPLVSAIAELTSLQYDVLSARRMAIMHLKSKVSTCSYAFDSILPVAIGPSVAKEGEKVEFKVFMAAYDSHNQPAVKFTEGNEGSIDISEGIAIVKVVPKSGINTYKGTVSIMNKSGEIETKNWEWKINALPK